MADWFSPDLSQVAAAANQPTMPTFPSNPADPRYSMLARLASAAGIEAQRAGGAVKGALENFIGPIYGQGQVGSPQFADAASLLAQLATAGMGRMPEWDPGPAGYGRAISGETVDASSWRKAITPPSQVGIVSVKPPPPVANPPWSPVSGPMTHMGGMPVPEVGSPWWNVHTGAEIRTRGSDFPPHRTIGGDYANIDKPSLVRHSTQDLTALYHNINDAIKRAGWQLIRLRQLQSGQASISSYADAQMMQNPGLWRERLANEVDRHTSLADRLADELHDRGVDPMSLIYKPPDE